MQMRYLIYIIVPIILFFSCQKAIVIDLPPHEAEFIVHCHLEEDSTKVEAWISSTTGILDSSNILTFSYSDPDSMKFAESYWVENATVELYENNTLVAILLADTLRRIYKANLNSPLAGRGNTYRIVVNSPDIEKTASSEIEFPPNAQANNFRHELSVGVDEFGDPIDQLDFDLLDPANFSNVYAFDIEIGIQISGLPSYFYSSYTPDSRNPKIEIDENGLMLLSDQGIDGEAYPLEFTHFSVSDYDTTIYQDVHGLLLIESIGKDYYWHQRSLSNYYNSEGNPFAEPVVIHTNIENGRGLFYGSSIESFRFEVY